jgi:hypothetical protein
MSPDSITLIPTIPLFLVVFTFQEIMQKIENLSAACEPMKVGRCPPSPTPKLTRGGLSLSTAFWGAFKRIYFFF